MFSLNFLIKRFINIINFVTKDEYYDKATLLLIMESNIAAQSRRSEKAEIGGQNFIILGHLLIIALENDILSNLNCF